MGVAIRVAPRAPFSDWTVQRIHEDFGFFWRFAPGVLVSQSTVDHATMAAAERLASLVDLMYEHDVVGTDRVGIEVLHDWRSFRGHDTEARRYLQQRIRSKPKGYVTVTRAAWQSGNKMMHMAGQAIGMTMTVFSGGSVQLSDDVHELAHAAGIVGKQPEAAPDWFLSS